MHHVWGIPDRAAKAGSHPAILVLAPALAPLTLGQHEVEFVGRMGMIGIPDMRRHKADTENHVVSFFGAAGPNDDGVAMSLSEAIRIRPSMLPLRPRHH